MSFKNFDISGKTSLITGAGGLLGIEHAKALLESGSNVLLTDISENALNSVQKKLRSQYGKEKILAYVMDVSTLDSINKVSNNLLSRGIRIDILINNAAIDPKVKGEKLDLETTRLENFPLGDWEHQLAVGLTGAFLCSRVFGSLMARDGKGGVIINIASDLSINAPDQRLYFQPGLPYDKQPVKPVTYSVIKAGLIGLTNYLSTYWADKGVRCNALSPGGVFNDQSEEFVNRLSSLIPLGRMAQSDEYHSAIQFLCSDASAYMNGQNLVIDGGRSVW